MEIKLNESRNQRRLHLGSFFVDLNESDYQELIKIFSGQPNAQQEIENCSKGAAFRKAVTARFKNTDSGSGEMTQRERILLWICSSQHVISS